MFGDMRNRVTNFIRSRTPQPSGQCQGSGEQSRTRRAGTVAGLQLEVRRLQQEISDLSETEDVAASSDDAERESDQMQLLHRQLEQKQHELARYQARI
jgi:hypothetical protein